MQSKQWTESCNSTTKKAMTVWQDDGIYSRDCLSPKRINDKANTTLERKKIIFHHENARSHTIVELKYHLLPPYSADFIPSLTFTYNLS